MKKYLSLLMAIMLVIMLPMASVSAASSDPLVIYVAPGGTDQTQELPQISNPLATLQGARDYIRAYKTANGSLPQGGVSVLFRGGQYNWTDTVEFTSEDSGSETAPVKYCAYPGETPVFTGGYRINGSEFSSYDAQTDVLNLSDATAAQKILTFDLKSFLNEKGYTDKYDYYPMEYDEYSTNDFKGLVFSVGNDNGALWLARYPDKTAGKYSENPLSSYMNTGEVTQGTADDHTVNSVFSYSGDLEPKIDSFASAGDIYLEGYPNYVFYHEQISVSVNKDNNTITTNVPSNFGFKENSKYFLFNIPSEISQAGEYYVDESTGILYVYPNADLVNSYMNVAAFENDNMITTSSASNIIFSGIAFENTKGSVITTNGGDNVRIEYCDFNNIGMNAVNLGKSKEDLNYTPFSDYRWRTENYEIFYGCENNEDAAQVQYDRWMADSQSTAVTGTNHGIYGCKILNTANSAVNIIGGNFYRNEECGFYVENCEIYFPGVNKKTYSGAVKIGQGSYGVIIKNNKLGHAPSTLISGSTTKCEIVGNEIFDGMSESYDNGLIYINYIVPVMDVKIENNYFHDVVSETDITSSLNDASQRSGIAFDNIYAANATIKNNVFENIPRGMFINCGEKIQNNTFINCYDPIYTKTMNSGEYFKLSSIENPNTEDFFSEDNDALYDNGFTYLMAWPVFAKNDGAAVKTLWNQKYPVIAQWLDVVENQTNNGYYYFTATDNNIYNSSVPLWSQHILLNNVTTANSLIPNSDYAVTNNNYYDNNFVAETSAMGQCGITGTAYFSQKNIEAVYGSKDILKIDFEKDVINANATVYDICDNVIESSTSYDAQANSAQVNLSSSLSTDGTYKLMITYGASNEFCGEKYFKYDVLYEDDCSAKTNFTKPTGEAIDVISGKLVSTGNYSYPTFVNKALSTDDWNNYTVEFVSDDTASPAIDGRKIELGAYLYVDNYGYGWDAGYKMNSMAAVRAGYVDNFYVASGATNSTRLTLTNDNTNIASDLVGKRVVYSASIFDKNIYENVKQGNEFLSKATTVIPEATNFDKGTFGIVAFGYTNYYSQQAAENSGLGVDNILCYKLKETEKPKYLSYDGDIVKSVYGSKDLLKVEFNEDVIDSDVKVYDLSGNEISSSSTYSAADKNMLINMEAPLSLDGIYKMVVSYGSSKEISKEVYFDYTILLEDDFSSFDATKQKLISYGDTWTVENDNFVRAQHPYYATYANMNLANSDWKDYTVEYDYYDKLESTQRTVDFATLFYVNSFSWSVDGNSAGNFGVGIRDNGYTVYRNTAGESKSIAMSGSGSCADIIGKNVRYKTSLFGNTAYANIENLADNSNIYSKSAVIGEELAYTGGTFAFVTQAKKDSSEMTYLDNLICYKLNQLSKPEYLSYDGDVMKSVYGSKNTIQVEFNVDIAKITSVNATCISDNTVTNATATYDRNTKMAVISMNSPLDVDKVYKLNITYGAAGECTNSLSFGYDVLLNDDFSDSSKTESLFNDSNNNWEVSDGKLVRTANRTYLTFLNTAQANENWTDYTVEMKSSDSSSQAMDGRKINLGVMFNVNSFSWTTNSDDIGGRAGAFTDLRGVKSYSDVSAQKVNANNGGDALGVLSDIACKDVTYSASLFGNNLYETVLDSNNSKLYMNNYTYPGALQYNSGAFAIVYYGYKVFWNPQEVENTNYALDDILCYKLKTVSTDYEDYEGSIIGKITGNKNEIHIPFNTDVVNADATLKLIGTNAKTDIETISTVYKNNMLVITSDDALDLKKKYEVTVNYGVLKEKTITKDIGYKVLFDDDFDSYDERSDSITTTKELEDGNLSQLKSKWQNINSSRTGLEGGIIGGKLVSKSATHGVYPIFSNSTLATDDWCDYTVEYDTYITHTNTGWNYIGFVNYFYTDGELLENPEKWNRLPSDNDALAAVMTDTASNNGYVWNKNLEKIQVAKSGTVTNEANMRNKQLKITASLLDNEYICNITDSDSLNNTARYNVGSDLTKEHGGFAISMGDINSQIDNVVCYKLYELTSKEIVFDSYTLSGTSASATLKVTGTENVVPVLALYNEKGKLIAINTGVGADAQTITIDNIDISKVKYAYVFAWETLDTLKPVTGKIRIN